ncbi:hypothetical protein RhiJN_13543 [Ceratobasidium sp. AG-Ba]|nr:hypothetical protein RhiJN_13543 [Ceratobasidium sp. AG-Ba]QRW14101.1 hypothetical protein RhiLY_13100 [Ceratobasidium sp. AG-Ba]
MASEQPIKIDDLPEEMIVYALKFCNFRDVPYFAQTSKHNGVVRDSVALQIELELQANRIFFVKPVRFKVAERSARSIEGSTGQMAQYIVTTESDVRRVTQSREQERLSSP